MADVPEFAKERESRKWIMGGGVIMKDLEYPLGNEMTIKGSRDDPNKYFYHKVKRGDDGKIVERTLLWETHVDAKNMEHFFEKRGDEMVKFRVEPHIPPNVKSMYYGKEDIKYVWQSDKDKAKK